LSPDKAKIAGLGLGVAALAVAAATLPLGRLGAAGPAAAVAAGALLIAALMPRTAVSLACGALLGAPAGATCALAAAMLAAAGTFAAGRWLGRDFIAARARGRLVRLDAWLARRGLLAVVMVRLLPMAPFGLVGYAYGTTSARPRHYLLGTLIAATPSAFTYAVIGAAVVSPASIGPLTLIPAAIGALFSTAVVVYWRRTRERWAAG
jgi:uncharacterized membrane protein YdjX (TVP38/TMEM64 family)